MTTILVVEDEQFLAMPIKDNLEIKGFQVDLVGDGEAAVEQLRQRKPDLILLDLLLPKKDGFYVLKELKNHPDWANIPVIVLSNLGGDEEIKRALDMGASDYFVKSQHPIEEVLEKVNNILGESE